MPESGFLRKKAKRRHLSMPAFYRYKNNSVTTFKTGMT
jgi:hypothetical protein